MMTKCLPIDENGRRLGLLRYRVFLDIAPETEFFFVAFTMAAAWSKFQWNYHRTCELYPSKADWKIEEVKP